MASEEEPLYKTSDIDNIIDAVAIEPTSGEDMEFYFATQASGRQMQVLLAKSFEAKPVRGLGDFSRLPVEILVQVIRGLDVKTCLALRQTNRAVRELVTGLSEYKLLTSRASSVFDAVFEAGIASHVTLQQLDRLFREHKCMICSSADDIDYLRFFDSRAPKSKPKIAKSVNSVEVYRASLISTLKAQDNNNKMKKKMRGADTVNAVNAGNTGNSGNSGNSADLLSRSVASAIEQDELCAGRFLFLPTMTRCCRPCLEESPRLRAPFVDRLCIAADMPRSEFESVLCKPMFTSRARKSMHQSPTKDRLSTVPQDAATRILLNAGFPLRRAKTVLMESGYLGKYAWVDDLFHRKYFVVPMPFLGPNNKEVSRGYTCAGCRIATDNLYKNHQVPLEYTIPMYSTKQAFLEHFKHCPEAIRVWKESALDTK